MTRANALIALLFVGVAALGAGIYAASDERRVGGGEEPRSSAASLLALGLPNAAGNQVAVAQWRGELLIVNFWATWCAPCREEMPEFIRLQREFGPKGLQIIGIAVDDADKVGQFATEIGLNYPALVGGYGAMELSRTLGNRVGALPFTVIVGRDGKVEYTQLGPIKTDLLRGIIGKLI